MPLSFAGVSLLLDQPTQDSQEGELVQVVQGWLDRYSPLDQLNLFGPANQPAGNVVARNPGKQAVSLPCPHYSDPPPLRLNTLYYPATGACRWAHFVGLVDEARLDKIVAAINTSAADTSNKHGALTFSEGDSHRKRQITTNMYMLPPRRVTVDARAGATKLWLLPLVDERYLWQFLDVGNVTASGIGSATFAWTLFLSATKLGSIVPLKGNGFDADTVSADYQKPDALAFDTREENVARVIDAAAQSVGMRVVRDFDGICYLMAPARAATRLQDSLGPSADLNESGYEIIVGGKADKYNALRIPSTLTVLFPKWWNSGNYHAVTLNATDVGVDAAAKTIAANKVIYTTAEAEYDDINGALGTTGAINNSANCTTLATKIARDWYAWQAEVYDYTFVGLKKWKPNGFDDWLIYNFASNHPNGEPLTRVFSHACNFGESQQLQSFRFSGARGIFHAFSTAATTVVAGANTTVALAGARGDLDGFTLAANEITVKHSGFYTITLFAKILPGGTGSNLRTDTYVGLERDSGAGYAATVIESEESRTTGGTAWWTAGSLSVTAVLRLEAGDKLRVICNAPLFGTTPDPLQRTLLTIEH